MIDPLDHLDLVKRNVCQMARTVPKWVDREDMAAAGTLGLVEAARRFDESKGVPFEGFARLRVRGAIIDHLRKAAEPVGVGTVGIEEPVDEEDGRAWGSFYAEENQYQPEVQVEAAERSADLTAALMALPPRERFVVTGQFLDRLKIVELAARLDLTDGRVCQIRALAFRRMRNALAAA